MNSLRHFRGVWRSQPQGGSRDLVSTEVWRTLKNWAPAEGRLHTLAEDSAISPWHWGFCNTSSFLFVSVGFLFKTSPFSTHLVCQSQLRPNGSFLFYAASFGNKLKKKKIESGNKVARMLDEEEEWVRHDSCKFRQRIKSDWDSTQKLNQRGELLFSNFLIWSFSDFGNLLEVARAEDKCKWACGDEDVRKRRSECFIKTGLFLGSFLVKTVCGSSHCGGAERSPDPVVG